VITAPGVLVNDNDVDGNTLTAIKVTDPAHGTLTLNANGGFTYKPSGKYVGSDSFNYKANDGSLDSASATVSITISKPTVVGPTAVFTATPNDLTVQFTDLSSGTAPLSYSWNFGDKKTSNAQNPTHTYSNAGSYTVKLTVKNSAGSNMATKMITVIAPPQPTAAFHSDVQTGPAPLTVKFTDDSTGTAPLTYSWNFGDKKTSTLQNPTHIYTKAGSYTATLTVKNSGGSTTATNTIIVS
jgi:VCBS repeat-containing protein